MNKKDSLTTISTLKAKLAGLLLLGCLAGWSFGASATIVQFQTVLGDFQVNLFDNITPETVANFLEYVEDEAYTDTFFHRSLPGFIVQGGGFTYAGGEDASITQISTNAPVINEPHLSNQRGTIAMAKVGNNPNSATSQWFFNLSNNSANLDNQNGGFTVFGQVIGNGMAIVDAIAALETYRFRAPLGDLPLRDYSDEDLEEETPVTNQHLVMITGIVILDHDPNTADDLEPLPTTRSSKSSSGSAGALLVLALGILALGRRQRRLVRRS